MSAHKRNSRIAGIALVLLTAGLLAEEQPVRVPWSKIESWATHGSAPAEATQSPEPAKTQPSTEPATNPTTQPANPPAQPEPAVVRSGGKRALPQAWLERQAQISAIMSTRLRTTQPNQHRQLFEINQAMEQYDKAIIHLTSMLKDSRKFVDEDATGWIAGRLWETALLQGGTPNPDVLKKYFDEWQAKERARLRVQASVLSAASLKSQEEHFVAHQAFFNERKNIAEIIKQKELEGETNPAALWEMSDRFYHGHPDVPIVSLRFLYKLREWYPNHMQVKDGTVQQRIAFTLATDRLRLYKEAAEEMELFIQRWPEASYPANGWADYYASSYWINYGDVLKDSRDNKGAREAWQKALEHAQKLRASGDKKGPNAIDADSGRSDTDSLFRRITDEDRLGSRIGG